jgi:hypothetical protein
MSLLDRGPGYEDCTVIMEVVSTDADGNRVTKPGGLRIPTKARFQIQNQSGTSSRRAESNDEGFETEKVYSCRFSRAFDAQYGELGAQATIEWGLDSQGRPAVWEIFGDVLRYTSSPRTKHNVYTLRRY